MSVYFAKRDLGSVTAFTDAAALFDFKFDSEYLEACNSSSSVAFELSFDGIGVHGYLFPTAASSPPVGGAIVNFADHTSAKLYIRRASGSGGTHEVTVRAWNR